MWTKNVREFHPSRRRHKYCRTGTIPATPGVHWRLIIYSTDVFPSHSVSELLHFPLSNACFFLLQHAFRTTFVGKKRSFPYTYFCPSHAGLWKKLSVIDVGYRQSTKAMNSSPFFFDCRFQKNKKISRQGLAKCTYCCILLTITLIIHRRGSFWACGRSERWGARGVSGKIRKNEKKGHSDSEIISLSGSKQHYWFDAYSQLLMFPGLLLVSGDGNTFHDTIEFLCLVATIG